MILTKDTTPYDLNKTLTLGSSLKRILKTQLRHLVRYQCNTLISKHVKHNNNKNKTNERTRDAMEIAIDTPSTSPITNEDNVSTLLDENNKTEQANVTKIISENNEYNKLTFLQMLEDNNNKNKTRHYGNFTDNHVRK